MQNFQHAGTMPVDSAGVELALTLTGNDLDLVERTFCGL
jgi:hypothetical protein